MSAYTDTMALIRAGEILSATEVAEKIGRSRTCAANVLRKAYLQKEVQVFSWRMSLRGQYAVYGAYTDGVDAVKPVVTKEDRTALARSHFLEREPPTKAPPGAKSGNVLFDLYVYPQLMKPRY